MIDEAKPIVNGVALMWSEKVSPLDREAFCWAGLVGSEQAKADVVEDDPSDHIVNVLTAQIDRDGYFNAENVMKTYREWTGQTEGT